MRQLLALASSAAVLVGCYVTLSAAFPPFGLIAWISLVSAGAYFTAGGGVRGMTVPMASGTLAILLTIASPLWRRSCGWRIGSVRRLGGGASLHDRDALQDTAICECSGGFHGGGVIRGRRCQAGLDCGCGHNLMGRGACSGLPDRQSVEGSCQQSASLNPIRVGKLTAPAILSAAATASVAGWKWARQLLRRRRRAGRAGYVARRNRVVLRRLRLHPFAKFSR